MNDYGYGLWALVAINSASAKSNGRERTIAQPSGPASPNLHNGGTAPSPRPPTLELKHPNERSTS